MKCPMCGRAMFREKNGFGAITWDEYVCPECGNTVPA
jgi:transposase-like protein